MRGFTEFFTSKNCRESNCRVNTVFEASICNGINSDVCLTLVPGPFSSREMGEWNDLGYFKEDLLIRRAVDQQFLPLGQVQIRYQANPFRSTRHPPALTAPAPPGKP